MEEKSILCKYFIYDDPDELTDGDRVLLLAARKMVEGAYAPYSGFSVGAALRLMDGTILGGSNYENASYPLGLCAEKAVLAAAHAQHPGKAVQALAVVVRNAQREILQPAAPCGGCRQVILETERKNNCPIRILMQGESGSVHVVSSARDLLPLAFNETFLK